MSTGQRILLRFVSALVGLLLLGAALLGIGQVIAGMTGEHDFILPFSDWYHRLRTIEWSATETVYAGVGLLVVGLLLLLVSLLTRPRLFALARPTESIDVVIAPRAAAQMLRRQAEAVPGVSSASVEVTPGVAQINAVAPMASPERVERDLEAALTHALKKIPWARLPRIELEVISERPAAASAGTPRTADLPDGVR